MPGSRPFSAGDKRLSADDRPDHFQGVVEDDHVGRAPRGQAPEPGEAQDASGNTARGLERAL